MIEKLKKKSETWTDYYMGLLDVSLTDSNRKYGSGVKDGALNTCIPAFMAGAKEFFRLLVKKVGLIPLPTPKLIFSLYVMIQKTRSTITAHATLTVTGNCMGA